MVVHAIEIVSAPTQKGNPDVVPEPSPPNFEAAGVEKRVQNNILSVTSEALPSQAQEVGLAGGGPENTTEHLRGLRRFDSNEDKAQLLDRVANQVVADAEWYEVRYHECDHDEPSDQRSGCSDWTAERSSGTVPSEV